jgi:ribosomal protein S18 acetylase RimI-like enzyme
MAIRVREALPADAGTIVSLARALTLEEGYPAPALQAEDVRAEAFGARPRFRVLIAERDGVVVGYALFFPAYDTDNAERGLYLQDLYVVPEARRRGAGRALMAAVARACAADGGRYVFWNARPENHAGLAFYRAIGARREPTVTLSLQPDALQRLAAADGSEA